MPGPGLQGPSDGVLGTVGVASSPDGLNWTRSDQPCGDDDAAPDSGAVLTPSADWWTFDTAGVGMADVQVRRALSSSAIHPGWFMTHEPMSNHPTGHF